MSPLENKIEELLADIADLTERVAVLQNKSAVEKPKENNLFNVKGIDNWANIPMIKKTSTVPTYSPRTREEQIVLFVNSTETKLYVYNNSAWKYTTLT